VEQDGFTEVFSVDHAKLKPTGKSDFVVLEPGYRMVYQGQVQGKQRERGVTVLKGTQRIDGVDAAIVESREKVDGVLSTVSQEYLAIDPEKGDVYCFGKNVDEYRGGKVVAHTGSWESEKQGAHAGMIMPGRPTVNQKFYSELAPSIAMGRSEV